MINSTDLWKRVADDESEFVFTLRNTFDGYLQVEIRGDGHSTGVEFDRDEVALLRDRLTTWLDREQ